MIRIAVALAVLAAASPLAAQDTKGLADQAIRLLRATQHADGTYGSGLPDTCRVLSALSRSPRRYTELDGPLFRKAADAVVAGQAPDALVALALADTLTSDYTERRDRALAALRPGPDYDTLLALRSFGVEDVAWPDVDARDDAGLRCLAAGAPGDIAAPPVTDREDWVRWARAARVRGLRPDTLPELPAMVAPDTGFDELLATLELAIVCHGLVDGGSDGLDEPLPAIVAPGQSVDEALERALAFLEAEQRGGTFFLAGLPDPEPGITALNLSAALYLSERLGRERPPWVDRGLDWLASLQRDDGAIMTMGLGVYTTAVAIEALADGGREQDRAVIVRARDFLATAQADEGEGYSSANDPHYGGIGYGGDERPDLSNTHMAIEAARRAGMPPDHEMFRKARVYLERCQNYGEGEVATWPRRGGGRLISGTDGGATYMPGNSPAGEEQVGEDTWSARSYGSMTYALTKSFLLCGVSPDDDRLQASVRWIAENFDLEENPGFDPPEKGADGLYYYYLAMARTLGRLPDETVPRWREQLVRHLLDRQRDDGSWINERSGRWWEGAPTLATAYALLTLKAAGA